MTNIQTYEHPFRIYSWQVLKTFRRAKWRFFKYFLFFFSGIKNTMALLIRIFVPLQKKYYIHKTRCLTEIMWQIQWLKLQTIYPLHVYDIYGRCIYRVKWVRLRTVWGMRRLPPAMGAYRASLWLLSCWPRGRWKDCWQTILASLWRLAVLML